MEKRPSVLSLFTGIGLHDLGLQRAGWHIAGQCEIDEFCTKVLAKHWPDIPRWKDVKDVTAASVREACGRTPDIVTGGFPCQSVSCAGKGEGIGTEEAPTERSGLWWQMKRVIEELMPPWVLVENVPALKQRGVDEVLKSLEKLGYQCWPLVVGAWAAGAPHSRNRVWIVATNRKIGLVNDCVPTLRGMRWPMGQGTEQFDWEHPRLVRSTRGDDPGTRRNQIKALGNANPPHVPEALGWAIRNLLEAQSGEVLLPEPPKDKNELVFTSPVDEDSEGDRYSQVGRLLRKMLKSQLPAKGAWKRSKTPRGRNWWVFRPLVKFKAGKAWHTPRAIYGEHPGITSTTHLPGQAIMWATPRASDASHGGPNQRDSAGNYALPAQVFHVGGPWPTPRASEHKDCGPKGSKSQRHMLGKKYLCATVAEIEGHEPSEGTYKLSPAWEAQLMGAPEGWLDL
jgi:DNA (cytosine-5)-methyltransferase 1